MIRLPLFALAASILVTPLSFAFERPVISIQHPMGFDPLDAPPIFSTGANITVVGEIKPPVGKRVKVQIFQVLDDGKLLRMAGANTPVTEGKFQMSIDSPGGGWATGQMRIQIYLDDMPQVKSSVDVTVTAPPLAGPLRGDFKPPEESGITLDLEKCRGTTVRLPVNKLFYIRGSFECEGIESKFEGPGVWGSVTKEPIDGAGKVIYQSASSLSVREIEGKTRFGYELQMHLVKPGVYGVRVTPHVGMWLAEVEREKPDFMIDVSEPAK